MDALASVRKAKEEHLKLLASAMSVATEHASQVVYDAILAETEMTDHSLQELRKLGHPYAQGKAPGQPHPDWLIHYQKGSLQEGLKRGEVVATHNSAEVEITSASDHTWYLLLGTRRMRPRDFVSAALITTQKVTSSIYEFYFKSVLDSKGSGRFKVQVNTIPNDRYVPQLPSR